MKLKNSEKSKYFYSLVTVFLIYISTIFILPNKTFWITDGGNKFLIIQNLLKKNYKDFFIDNPANAIISEAKYSPLNNENFYKKGDSYFSMYSFLFPWISSFFFKWFSYQGLYIIPAISSLLLLVVSSKIYSHLWGANNQWAVIAVLGLCSPLFFYSVVFWGHSLTALLAMFSVLMLLKFASGSQRKYLITAGITAGLSCWVRTDGFLFSAACILSLLFVYGFHRNLYIFAATLALSILPFWLLNHNIYGHIFGIHILNFMKLDLMQVTTGESLKNFSIFSFIKERGSGLFSLLFQAHKNEKYSLLLNLPFFAFLSFFFWETKNISRKYNMIIAFMIAILLSEAIAMALNAQSAVPIKNTTYTQGLFLSLPYSVFFFMGIVNLLKNRDNKIDGQKIIALVAILYILLFALVSPFKSGIIWGPRIFVIIIPILVVFSINRWRELINKGRLNDSGKRWLNRLVFLIILISFVYQLFGIKLLYNKKAASLSLMNKVSALSSKHIITDIFWIPEEMSAIFYDKVFYYIDSDKDSDFIKLMTRLKENGVRRFSLIVSPFYSHIFSFSSPFGISGLEGLTGILLTAQSREPVEFKGAESYNTVLIDYTIN